MGQTSANGICVVCDSTDEPGGTRRLPIAPHIVETGYRRDSSLLEKSRSLGRTWDVYPCRIVFIAHRENHGIEVTLTTVREGHPLILRIDAAA